MKTTEELSAALGYLVKYWRIVGTSGTYQNSQIAMSNVDFNY